MQIKTGDGVKKTFVPAFFHGRNLVNRAELLPMKIEVRRGVAFWP